MLEIKADGSGFDALATEMLGWGKHSDRAEMYALGRVASQARTRIVRAVAAKAGVPQKAIRPRFRNYKYFRRKFIRVWGGLLVPLREKELGQKVDQFAPPGAKIFSAKMKSGHSGRFYKSQAGGDRTPRFKRLPRYPYPSPDLPISEVRKTLRIDIEDEMLDAVDDVFKQKFGHLYWRDLRRRLGIYNRVP